MYSDKEFMGVFKGDSSRMGAFLSTMAEAGPGMSETMSRGAIRGLNFQEGKWGEVLAKAGVKPGMDPIEQVQRLAPVVMAEAQAKNVPLMSVLSQKDYHLPEEMRLGLATAIGKGVGEDIFAKRLKTAETAGGFAAVEKQFEVFEDPLCRRARWRKVAWNSPRRRMTRRRLWSRTSKAWLRSTSSIEMSGPCLV